MKFALFLVVAVALALVPTIPLDFSAMEETHVLINKNGARVPAVGFCCSTDKTGECEIQAVNRFRKHFQSTKLKADRYDDDSSIIVALYNQKKECKVDSNMKCLEYCPLKGNYESIAIDKKATNSGKVYDKGTQYNRWSWTDYVIIVPMADHHVLCDLPGEKECNLHKIENIIKPMGIQAGTSNITFSKFTPGEQPASLFAVTNLEKCPIAKDCNGNDWQLHRASKLDVSEFLAYYSDNEEKDI